MEERVNKEGMESIAKRLSTMEDLYFPRSLQPDASSPSQRNSLLFQLLSRDPAVFLERYGAHLTLDELQEFDVLNDNYEVNWYLKNLRSKLVPTSEDLRTRSVTVKNRRLAYLNRLILDGNYFSEDAMREREPYLHHEFVGKFQDQSARRMARPGERWSETLMRRAEEAVLVSKIREEQQRLGVAESEWVGNEINQQQVEEEEEEEEEEEMEEEEEEEEEEMEEKEEEEEEEEEPKKAHGDMQSAEMFVGNDGSHSSTEKHDAGATFSAEDLEDRMDQFTSIMHQKFLSGEDHQHLDYSKIDDDVTLDDHWFREANYDAEEKYFGGDDDL